MLQKCHSDRYVHDDDDDATRASQHPVLQKQVNFAAFQSLRDLHSLILVPSHDRMIFLPCQILKDCKN